MCTRTLSYYVGIDEPNLTEPSSTLPPQKKERDREKREKENRGLGGPEVRREDEWGERRQKGDEDDDAKPRVWV